MTTATNPTKAWAEATAASSPPADDQRWARPAAAAGIAFVVLNVAGTFAPGAPPAADASSVKIATYFRDHAGGIKLQLFLGCIGIAALVWWFGAVWRIMCRAENERPRLAIVASVSLGIGLTLAMMSSTFTSAAAFRIEGADVTALLYSLSLVAVAAANFGIGTFLVATCLLMYRTQVAPRWTSYLGGTAGLAFYVGGIGTATDSSTINALGVVAFLIWCVWIIAVSVRMWRGQLTAATAT